MLKGKSERWYNCLFFDIKEKLFLLDVKHFFFGFVKKLKSERMSNLQNRINIWYVVWSWLFEF